MMAKKSNNHNREQDIAIAKLSTDLKWVKRELTDIKENHLTSIYKEIRAIKEQLNKRPSWVFTALVSILTALVVYVLTLK